MTVKKQKNGKWLVSVSREGVPRVRKVFKTQKDAEIFEREFLDGHKLNIQINSDRRTLKELIDIWFRYHGMNLSDGEHRRRQLNKMAGDMGNMIATELTPSHLLDYRYERINGQGSITPKTFNNIHGYLNAVFRKLKKLKIIDYDCPTCEIEMIKIQQRQLEYLSIPNLAELLAITEKTSNESVWWIAQICIRTGARWGEAENLTKKQLHNESITFEFTKSKKIRTIGLDADFYNKLMQWSRLKNPTERIFTNSYFTFCDLLRKSDLKLPIGQKSHILRHSYASHFIMNGGDIVTLKTILGHSDIKMTMRYAHLAPDHLRDAMLKGPITQLESLDLVP